MSVSHKAPAVEPEWSYNMPAVEPHWRSMPAVEPEWGAELEHGLGRIAVSEIGTKGPALETFW